MMLIDGPAAIECRPVENYDPILQEWVGIIKAQNPHFSHASDYSPGAWMGLYAQGILLSIYGFTHCTDGTVFVEYAACKPTRAGRVALEALTRICYESWKGKSVRFLCETKNRKMRRIVEGLGAKPVAYMYQIYPGGADA